MKLRADGSGPLVVKLAGIAGGTGLCREEIDVAVAAGFRIAALDTTGDRHDDPAPGPLTWEALAADVHRGLDLLGAERAILWGTSFGCLVAMAAAARGPDRASGLLLCHPPEPWRASRLRGAALEWAARRSDPARAARLLFTLAFYSLAAWEAVVPTTLARLPRLALAAREAATPSSTVLDKLRLLRDGDPLARGAGARVPITIVAGVWDTVAPPSGARRLASLLPGAHLEVIPSSGHSGAHSRPRAYARVVVAELRRLAAASRG